MERILFFIFLGVQNQNVRLFRLLNSDGLVASGWLTLNGEDFILYFSWCVKTKMGGCFDF